jgi:RNA polymerase sigma factor (sigma-70 family)
VYVRELPAAPVVESARAGDRAALDALVSGYLPLVYNIVGRAADRDLDVDDVVQETMLRMVTGLPGLREPDRLRSWVVSIALRELADARGRAGRERARRTPEPELSDRTDPAADFEGGVLLRQALTQEQQEVARAATWLDPGFRAVLSSWWLEQCGELDRDEMAAALGESPGTVAVRIQRMREQLDTARSVVRALGARPRCAELAEVVGDWAGEPSPLWRKRIARHVRACDVCAQRSRRLVAPERLLAGLPMALPPAHLTAKATAWTAQPGLSAAGHGGAGVVVKPGLLAGAGAKVAVAAVAVALLGGGTYALTRPAPAEPTKASALPAAVASASVGSAPVRKTVSPGPSPSKAAPDLTPDLAPFSSSVPAFPASSSARVIGPITQNARVAGRDNGQSAAYAGRSVWIFDDTTLKNPFGFLSNSAAVTTDLNAANGIDLRSGNGFTVENTQTPVELIPRSTAEKAFEKAHAGDCKTSTDQYCGAVFGFWPGPVFADPARHRVLFTYGKLCRGGRAGTPCSGALGKGLGMGIAALDMKSGHVTRLSAGGSVTSVEGTDPTMFSGAGRSFGGAAAVVRGDTVYLYGDCDYTGCRLARAQLSRLTDLAAWRYYDGKAFQSDPARVSALIAPGAAGQTVFYNAAVHAWLNVYQPFGTNTIKYQVGGSPFGPWSAGRTILTTPSSGKSVNYALFAHPEYAERGGLVQYLSYYDPNTGDQQLVRWVLTR